MNNLCAVLVVSLLCYSLMAEEVVVEARDSSIVQITSFDGVVSILALTESELKTTRTTQTDEFNAALKAWQDSYVAYMNDPANRGKVFTQPKPTQPVIRVLKSTLTAAQARDEATQLLTKEKDRKENTFYKCMLGRYKNQKGDTQYVTLCVPDGTNTKNEQILSQMRGKIDVDLAPFVHTGKIYFPADGVYIIYGDGNVTIDEVSMGFIRKEGEATVKKGLHQITIRNEGGSGGFGGTAKIKIVSKVTKQEVPIFNSLLDIEQLLSANVNGERSVEVSGWKPLPQNEIKIPKEK